MSRPLKVYHGLNANSVVLIEDGDCCDVVVPFNVENEVELSLVELHGGQWPCVGRRVQEKFKATTLLQS